MDCVQSVKTINIRPSIAVCLLGLVDPLAPKMLLTLLFYACKIIILSWKKLVAPSIMAWKALVNNALIITVVQSYISQ